MKASDFLPRAGETNFQAWHERVCPEEHRLLKESGTSELQRAAYAEGRLSVLFEALTQWQDVTDSRKLILILLAGECALNERRISVGAVRSFLLSLDENGGPNG